MSNWDRKYQGKVQDPTDALVRVRGGRAISCTRDAGHDLVENRIGSERLHAVKKAYLLGRQLSRVALLVALILLQDLFDVAGSLPLEHAD